MRINKPIVVYIASSLALGLIAGYFFGTWRIQKHEQEVLAQAKSIREKGGNYQFINPLLAYDLPESTEIGEYIDLTKQLNDLIDLEKRQKNVDQVSIYFRGAKGRWVGINDYEKYYPASLLKVVVMIAYYQQAQSNPEVLNKELLFNSQIQNQVASSQFNVPSYLKLDNSYKVGDLIRDMIVDSDNGATFTLVAYLDNKVLNEVYSDLGLEVPDNTGNYVISAKDYSLFFRILYNATYLNRGYSEKALDLLSQTNYNNGLVAGLPDQTLLSHKFGEHIVTDSKGVQTSVELHDCGIVYGKQNLLLCVMTKGQQLPVLEKVIQEIAKLVYQEAEK